MAKAKGKGPAGWKAWLLYAGLAVVAGLVIYVLVGLHKSDKGGY